MYMQMSDRLATVLTLVGYKTETVLKPQCVGERREFFEAFGECLRLIVRHLDYVCVMLFGDEQKMYRGLRIQVLYDDHIVVFVDFC